MPDLHPPQGLTPNPHGLDAHVLDAHGLDAHGLDAPGLDGHGLDAHGLDAHGLDAHGLDEKRDADQHQSGSRRRPRVDTTVLIAVSVGGAAGSAARYLIGQQWPAPEGTFPISTLTINVLGCALIGTLLVLITERWAGQPLLRPFLGTGVLGGFTTFSTYTVDIQRLMDGAHFGTAFLYLALTVVGALLAVWMAATATRRLVNGHQR